MINHYEEIDIEDYYARLDIPKDLQITNPGGKTKKVTSSDIYNAFKKLNQYEFISYKGAFGEEEYKKLEKSRDALLKIIEMNEEEKEKFDQNLEKYLNTPEGIAEAEKIKSINIKIDTAICNASISETHGEDEFIKMQQEDEKRRKEIERQQKEAEDDIAKVAKFIEEEAKKANKKKEEKEITPEEKEKEEQQNLQILYEEFGPSIFGDNINDPSNQEKIAKWQNLVTNQKGTNLNSNQTR
jgi:hypothetical protein